MKLQFNISESSWTVMIVDLEPTLVGESKSHATLFCHYQNFFRSFNNKIMICNFIEITLRMGVLL